MKTSDNALGKSCPFLGLDEDPQSLMAYISPQNFCHRCKPPAAVSLVHQNSFCLDAAHADCPVFREEAGRPLPSALHYEGEIRSQRRGWRTLVVGAILIGAFLFGGLYFSRQASPALVPVDSTSSPSVMQTKTVQASGSFPTATGATQAVTLQTVTPFPGILQPTQTLTVSPFPSLTPTVVTATFTKTPTATFTATPSKTNTPTLTQTSTFTITATVSPHSLEIPIGRGQLFLIHRVVGGENLNTLAERYQTSLEAILAVNYSLDTPIWADTLVVIPLGVKNPEGLPIFEPYQVVDDQITAEALAQKLACDAALFKQYNLLADGEQLRRGDWFLIPRDSKKP